jgi:hypothetical protein
MLSAANNDRPANECVAVKYTPTVTTQRPSCECRPARDLSFHAQPRASEGVNVLCSSAAMQANVSSALFGGEGLFQTRISGTGICVFESPVPLDEVMRIDLKDETLQVDGNFALMRTGRIEFSVEKSTRSLLGTLTSGEGLLQTFRGTGSVWLAPTQDIYERLLSEGISAMGAASRSSNTATSVHH